MMKFYVNAEKKTVVAVVKRHGKRYVGKAKCDEHDTFDEAIGKQIASLKLLIKLNKADEKLYSRWAERELEIMLSYTNRANKHRFLAEKLQIQLECHIYPKMTCAADSGE